MKNLAVALACSLSLPLAAQEYTTSHAGDGCGGATLTITFTPTGANQMMTLRAEGLHPRTLGGQQWGFVPARIGPVLALDCYILTESVWSITFMTDAHGRHTWQRAWPASILGHFYIQQGSLDVANVDLKLTNCVRAAHE